MSGGRSRNLAIALWGVGGVLLLLGQALIRLTPIALEPLLTGSLTAMQWAIYVGWVAFSAYTEGYRGFQKGFSPRVVRRAFELAAAPRPLFVLLAPAYCMSLFAAPRTRMIISWTVTISVMIAVIVVRRLGQPWRGIIDGGVVVGLGWGVITLLHELARGYAKWSQESQQSASASSNATH